MLIHKRFLVLLLTCSSFLNATPGSPAPLAPTTQVITINGASIIIPPAVAAYNNVFTVVGSAASNATYATHSSDNGSTWTSYVTGPGGVTRPIFLAANSTGILATWSNTTNQVYSSYSTDSGATWSTPVSIASNAIQPVSVCCINDHFIATWQGSDANAYAAFTTNNGTTWSSPITISNAGNIGSAVIVCTNGAGKLVATWRSSSSNAYASISTDGGSTWGSPSTISSSGNINADAWCSANSTGFVSTWRTSTNNAYSSFSTDGITWEPPIQIASSIISGSVVQDVSVAATINGFVAAWVGSDNNAYASFLPNFSSTWSTPVAVSSGGNIASLNAGYILGVWHPFIGVCTLNNTCMFTWDGTDAIVRTSFSNVINTLSTPANFAGAQKKNNFGISYEYYNALSWQPSTSPGVTGYYLYCNNTLIATILGAGTSSFNDHDQPLNTTTIYGIRAFNAYGDVSTLTQIRFVNGVASYYNPPT